MARDISKVLYRIEDEAGWEHAMEQSDSKLVVIDIHQEWCGCCEAVHPSMSRVLIDYDEIEQRFLYCTASIGKVGAKIQASLPHDSHVNLEKNGCIPIFGVYRGKTCIMVIQGVDSPTLLLQIAQNMPEKPVKE